MAAYFTKITPHSSGFWFVRDQSSLQDVEHADDRTERILTLASEVRLTSLKKTKKQRKIRGSVMMMSVSKIEFNC